VSAKDLATQKEQSIKITASSGLSKDEVDKLVRDAQAHTDDDKKRRKLAEAKNQADSLIYGTEKNLTEHGDKIGEDDKTKITEAIAALRKAMEGTDAEAIESATQTLTTSSHKLAEEMYKKASASASAGPGDGASSDGGGSQQPKDEKVVDAEFEEVDKDKK
jgi:molecular chaperone DnaK